MKKDTDIMTKEEITAALREMFADDNVAFEVVVVRKDGQPPQRLVLYEGDMSAVKKENRVNFKKQVQDILVQYMQETFLAETAVYESAAYIADNQDVYYMIKQDEGYRPFSILPSRIDTLKTFSVADRDQAKGLAFRFKRKEKVIWGYQQIYEVKIPNKASKGWLTVGKDDVFREMAEPLFPIEKKIDILIIEDEIITKNIRMMQRSFGFETFIRKAAGEVIERVAAMELVSNGDKLTDYVMRRNAAYARKMMRVVNSLVLKKSREEILNRSPVT